MVEHDNQIVKVMADIHGINVKLDPIARGVTSVAFGFRTILWFGAISISVVGMFELYHQLYPGT